MEKNKVDEYAFERARRFIGHHPGISIADQDYLFKVIAPELRDEIKEAYLAGAAAREEEILDSVADLYSRYGNIRLEDGLRCYLDVERAIKDGKKEED